MNERKFLDSIDACFPYTDPKRSRELALTALGISSNATFGLVEELAIPPLSHEAPITDRLTLLAIIQKRLAHPLAEVVLGLAERMIKGQIISVSEALVVMDAIREYPGEYAALSIAYFSCDDKDGEVDSLYSQIVANWESG